MIYRELPLISPFPDLDIVKEFSSRYITLPKYEPLFYDIETTGLSAVKSYCYLIGCMTYDKDNWILRQWVAEAPEEEPVILTNFIEFSAKYSFSIHYNGNKFDLPYLISRCKTHNIPITFSQMPGLDLYQELKILKKLLQFDHMKQPDLELFLGIDHRSFADGKICIKCYKDYLKKKQPELLQETLGHNLEDLCGLGQIFYMLSYRFLFDGNYTIQKCNYDGINFTIYFYLPYSVPTEFSYRGIAPVSGDMIYLTGNQQEMKLLVTSKNRCLKMYYPNYKDYSYLPSEDSAIPKSLSTYIDKSLKKPAKPETCYTWFQINDRFLSDTSQQYKYLKNLLEFYLNHA